MSRLLSLPPELRKEIWDAVLAPNSETRPGTVDERAVTTVSRACTSAGFFVSNSYHAHAHEQDDVTCACSKRPFYICDSTRRPTAAILRVSKQVFREAMPSLYERRTFAVDPNRRFVSLWDRCAEAWFLLDRFLQSLSEQARLQIRCIRVPMLLSRFEVQSAWKAFYSIAGQLSNLQVIEIEVFQSFVRQRWLEADGTESPEMLQEMLGAGQTEEPYFLGPVMAFADARIIVTAVDKHNLGGIIFERIKPHIEMKVWKQLLPVRVKHEQRKIAKIRRALRALEYDEVAVVIPSVAVVC